VRGRIIRTTAEHPFHRYEDGWVACNQLRVGDRIALEEGWAEVEGLVDTGSWETVCNFRIADFHTYFVGCDEWGFSVWAHNVGGCGEELGRLTNQGVQTPRSVKMNLLKTELHHIATNKETPPNNRWNDVFEHIFAGAGMRLDAGINLIRVQGHAGPHGLYNTAVFQRLFNATRALTPGTPAYRLALRTELAYIRVEIRHGTGIRALIRERVARNSPE